MGVKWQRERLIQMDKIKVVHLESEGVKQTHSYRRDLSPWEWRRPQGKGISQHEGRGLSG